MKVAPDFQSDLITFGKGNALIYRVAAFLFSVFLIIASKNVAFLNQGDFARAIGFMLSGPLDRIDVAHIYPTGFEWEYHPYVGRPALWGGSAPWLFWLAAMIQLSYSKFFSIFTMALLAKISLLYLANRIAARLAAILGGDRGLQFALFVATALILFFAHNVAVLNSFYNEFAFFLFLPLILFAVLGEEQDCRRRRVILCIGALFCGAAKIQFFYVPALLWAVFAFFDWRAERPFDKKLACGLMLVQLLSMSPVVGNRFRDLNYYHSTYLGSYMVLEPAEREALGLNEEQIACIGVDAWGVRLSAPDAVTITSGPESCFKPGEQTLLTVLKPYLEIPQVAWRMWSTATRPHFTVEYFHLDKSGRYLVPTKGKSFGLGTVLVRLSQWRDEVITRPVMLVVIAAGLLLPFIALAGRRGSLAAFSVFLALFALSQIAVSIVGEGVRDLSHHLSAAQYAVDLLVLVCAVQMAWRLVARQRCGREAELPAARG